MKRKFLIFYLLAVALNLNLNAQQIAITASVKPLNLILIEVRDLYHVDFSFNDQELSKYKVTVTKTFSGVEPMLDALLKGLPLQYQRTLGVYVIMSKTEPTAKVQKKSEVYRLSGRIMEQNSGEFLPYTNVLINASGSMSDQNGNFTYTSLNDSVFRIKITHLGYLPKDTVLLASSQPAAIYLKPFDITITEIMVSDNLMESFVSMGHEPATIKLNHKVSKYLPGSADNSVFNLLRLQPGILASGEQTNDVIIWGDYPGQSRVTFDGITLFGLKNFNDQISPINPLMVKNIELKKAGYDAAYGDAVGGIVEILGKDGSTDKPKVNVAVSNYTLNGAVEVPILKKSSLQLAYRQTYYNLFGDGATIKRKTVADNGSITNSILVYPDYDFNDLNLKYSLKTDKSYAFASVYHGTDQFDYTTTKTLTYREIEAQQDEKNVQSGAALFFQHQVSNHFISDINLTYSALSSHLNSGFVNKSTITGRIVNQTQWHSANDLAEWKANWKLTYQTRYHQKIEVDLQTVNNSLHLTEDSLNTTYLYQQKSRTYYTLGVNDALNIFGQSLNLGLRSSYLPDLDQFFFEPRASYQQKLGSSFKVNLAWGLYRQFLVKSTYTDNYENYRYNWTLADDGEVPVLRSEHWVGSVSYHHSFYVLNLDVFYKTTDGLTRYIKWKQNGVSDLYHGNGKTYGMDLYTKVNYKLHTLWVSYSLSESTEYFDYQRKDVYYYAPQDQRHELKLATIINFAPIYVSANYVYGSGFLDKPFQQKITTTRSPYSRLDMAVTYSFTKKRQFGEVGISVLNVLNQENMKYTSLEKIPLTQTGTINVYYEAVPFTPSVFLKLSF